MLEKRWHQGKKQRLRQNRFNTIKQLLPLIPTSLIDENLIACHFRLGESLIDAQQQRDDHNGTDSNFNCSSAINYDRESTSAAIAESAVADTTATAKLFRFENLLPNIVILTTARENREKIPSIVPSPNNHNQHHDQKHKLDHNHNHSKLMTTLKVEPVLSKDKYLLLIVIVPHHYHAPLQLLPLASLLALLMKAIYAPKISFKCKHYFSTTTWLKKSSQHIIGCHYNNKNNNRKNYHRPCYCCIDQFSNHQIFQAKEANHEHDQHNFNPNRYSLDRQKNHHLSSFLLLVFLLLLAWLLYAELLLLLVWSNPFDCYSPNQISTQLSILNYQDNDGVRQSHNPKKSLLSCLSSSSSSPSPSSYSIKLTRTRTIDEPLDNKNEVRMLEIGQLHSKSTNHRLMQWIWCNNSNNKKLLHDCCSITVLQQITIPFVACCLITAFIHVNRRWSIIQFPSSSFNHVMLTTISISDFASNGLLHSLVIEFSKIELTSYNPSIVDLWAKTDHFIIARPLSSNSSTLFDYQAKLHLIQLTSTLNNNAKDAHSVMPSDTPKVKKQFDWHQQQSKKFNYQKITKYNLHVIKSKLLFHSSSKSSCLSKLRRARLHKDSTEPPTVDLIDRQEKRNFRCSGRQLFTSPKERIRTKKSNLNCLLINFASLWLTWNILTYMCVNNKHNSQDRLVKLCSCSPIRQNRSSYSLYSTLKNINLKLFDGKNTRNRRMDILVQKDDSLYKEYLVTDMCQWKSNLFVPTSNDVYFSSYEYDPARRVAMYKQLLDLADGAYQARYDSNMMRGRIFSPPTTSPSIVLKIPTKLSKTFAGYEQACGINLIAPTGFRILARIYGRQSEIRQDEDEDRGLFNVSYLEGKETHHMVAESRGNIMSFRFLLDRDNYQRDPNLRFHVVATAFTTTNNEDFARQPKRASMFSCDHERLIDKSLVCDNFTNCEDGTDEDKSNCYLNLDADQQVTELYPGQTNNDNNKIASEDQIVKNLGDNNAPVSKLDQHQSTSWTSYVYTIMKLILLLLLLLLLALFCFGLLLMWRRRLRPHTERSQTDTADRISTPSTNKDSSLGVKKRFTRNRFQPGTATKGSIFSFNKPPGPRPSDLSTNLAVASMLPGGSGATNRPSTSATSTLTRPVPAKRKSNQPTRQTSQSPTVKQFGNKLDRFVELTPASRPSEQSLNVSYYHQSSMSRSFATPSPGGSILVPRETMRTVYMQTDKRPSYHSGLPSSQI